MKKTTLSFIVLGAFGLYTFWQSTSNPSALTESIKSLVLSKEDRMDQKSDIVENTPLAQPEVVAEVPTPIVEPPTPTTPPKTATKKVWVSTGDGDDDDEGYWKTVTTTAPIATPTTPKAPTPVVTVTPPPTTPTPKTDQYKDGQYTSPVVDAYYGNVQVVAVITGGKLVDVQFLDYPRQRSNSVVINTRATPLLAQEAITAQSANVNGVSGASFTSAAFKEALGAALLKAKA